MADLREDPVTRAETPPDTGEQTASEPLILTPVSAEDFARQKRRRMLILLGAALLVALVVGYIYKRSTDPLRAREAYDAGERLLKIARYPQAILSFDRAISLQADYPEAFLMRGKARATMSDTDRAIDDFTQAIALRPNISPAYLERASAYLGLRKFQLSLDDCTKAISIDAKMSAAYNLRGMVLRTMGKTEEALEALNKAVEIDPNLDNLYQRGATYQLLGNHKAAVKDFDLVVSFNPYSAQAYFARAESKRAMGDEAGAKRDHQRGRVLDGR
jgi:tetratricopeptide (TPR) repeat protein